MKLKELKRKLNKLSKEQLEQDFIVIAQERTLSGYGEARVSKSHLYWDGGDDPSNLYSKSELKEQDYDKEDIEGMELIIKKGQFYVELP